MHNNLLLRIQTSIFDNISNFVVQLVSNFTGFKNWAGGPISKPILARFPRKMLRLIRFHGIFKRFSMKYTTQLVGYHKNHHLLRPILPGPCRQGGREAVDLRQGLLAFLAEKGRTPGLRGGDHCLKKKTTKPGSTTKVSKLIHDFNKQEIVDKSVVCLDIQIYFTATSPIDIAVHSQRRVALCTLQRGVPKQ